ncbi:MAG: FecR family protein, partial [Pseudomonadota bacterium]
MTYTVDGARALPGSLVAAAPAAKPPVVAFSDGTRIRLAPQARTRVVNVGRRGARVNLDAGKADVEVAHLPGAEWFFEAGPFVITVHGTAFTLEWDAKSAHLGVQMRSGVVSVSGPVSGGEIVLRAGQTLSLNLNDQGGPSANDVTGSDSEPAPGLAPPAVVASPSAGTARAADGRRP